MSIQLPNMPDVTVDDVIANSFRDYHVKGFDYICLRRSPTETVKLYFFDGDVSKLPEVVNPHDHRYDFKTLCVAGAVENLWFIHDVRERSEWFHRFEYRTPLNGGSGFAFSGSDNLKTVMRETARAGQTYFMRAHEIHTIRLRENNTVIALVQHEDKVPLDQPTVTFTRDREPPSLDGLYRRFDADTVLKRLAALQARVPGLHLPRVI
jgi:hypothetical protein